MTITYCRNDPVSGRWVGVNRLLTEFEVDFNFFQHEGRITTLESNFTLTVSIASITQPQNDQLLITMTDSTTRGPFLLPSAVFTDTGTWLPSTPYLVNDTFTINGTLYRVLFAHTSALTFSAGANDGAGHQFYAPMVSSPGSALPTGGATGQTLQKSTGADFAVTWGYKLPIGGTANQVLLKLSATNQDVNWTTLGASMVSFTPSTASGLSSSNVADALEEVAVSAGTVSAAADITYTPPTGSTLISINVQSAIDELEAAQISGHSENNWSASPTGNVSTTEQAMGLGTGGGFLFTPTKSGIALVWIGGMVLNSMAAGDGVTITGRHGNGTAPTNGATTGLGTQFSTPQHFIASTAAGQQGFMVMGKVTGLTAGVTEWFDLSIVAVTGGGATVKDVQFVVVEVGF